MISRKIRRTLSVTLCVLLLCSFTVPAFAASDDLGFQYVFEQDFTFSDFTAAGVSGWYKIPLNVAASAEQIKADHVKFSIDGYSYSTTFKTATRANTFHYIGNGYAFYGFGTATDDPYFLTICPSDPSQNALYLRSDLFSPLFAGDNSKVHVAVSVAYNDLFATGDFLDNVTTVFASAMGMVATAARTVISHPILLAPLVIGLAGIAIVFYRRLKN